jgi:hypothetical protein
MIACLIPRSPVSMSRLGFYDSFFNTTFPSEHVEVRVFDSFFNTTLPSEHVEVRVL